MRDITEDLNQRMGTLSQELEEIRRKRQELDAAERDVEYRLQALKTTIEWERVLQGVSNGKSRWTGVEVLDAVRQVLVEHPDWKQPQIRDFLIADGFNFKGKNPGLSVNMALQKAKRLN